MYRTDISPVIWSIKGSNALHFSLCILAALLQSHVTSGECFSTGAPYDDDNGRDALLVRSQAIVTTYDFQCCGIIRNWRAYFQPGGSKHTDAYTVRFQVWRPVPNQMQQYTLVNDTRTSPQLSGNGEASVSASIMVEPGDVVGYYVTLIDGNTDKDEGIQLETSSHGNNVVWYNSGPDPPEPGQQVQVGTGSSFTSITAAPIINIDVSSIECPTIATTLTTSPNTGRRITFERTNSLSHPTSFPYYPTAPTLSVTSETLEMAIVESRSSSSVIAAVVVLVLLLLVGSAIAAFIGGAVWMARRNKVIVRDSNNQFSNPNYKKKYLKAKQPKSRAYSASNHYEPVSEYFSPYIKATYYSDIEGVGTSKQSNVKTKYTGKSVSVNTVETTLIGKDMSKEGTLIADSPTECTIIEQKYIEDDDDKRIYEYPGIVVPNQQARKEDNFETVKKYNKLTFFEEDQTFWVPASSSEALYDQLASNKYREIPRKDIIILEKIGAGEFGAVCKAVWNVSFESFMLAVKQLHSDSTSTERIKLLQEAAIMGQFRHKNVVKLYGLITIGNPVCLCLEYMSKGNLKKYLTSINIKRKSPPNGHKDFPSFFVKAAMDVASGMKYLSGKSFIHRDLAARNVLLNDFYICKIGDFGMSRDLMNDTYYTSTERGKIPVRWTSPEALLYKKYSTASDVWSFGMLLFEIWSLGKKPFPNFTISQVMGVLQREGYCQPPPPGCPSAIYKLMIECWNPDHHKRPQFEQIMTTLQNPLPHLLHFSDDQTFLPPAAADLGGDFSAAEKLHFDLQEMYYTQQ